MSEGNHRQHPIRVLNQIPPEFKSNVLVHWYSMNVMKVEPGSNSETRPKSSLGEEDTKQELQLFSSVMVKSEIEEELWDETVKDEIIIDEPEACVDSFATHDENNSANLQGKCSGTDTSTLFVAHCDADKYHHPHSVYNYESDIPRDAKEETSTYSDSTNLPFNIHTSVDNVKVNSYFNNSLSSVDKKQSDACETLILELSNESEAASKEIIPEANIETRRPFECQVCLKRFTKKVVLNNHLRIHTGEKPFQCDVCSKQFNMDANLKKHLRIHTGEKPHRCKICNKHFSRKEVLNKHSLTHTGERPFQCEVCFKGFTQVGHLKIHLRIHTGEKPYQCTVCGGQFSHSGSLKLHIRTHTMEKPYECTVCRKRFSGRSNLTQHYKVHTGEKPFQCNECNKQFSNNAARKKHFRTHTQEKPHQCDICKKRFSEFGNLKIHRRSHTGERPYKCTLCSKEFIRLKKLKLHSHVHKVKQTK